MDNFIKIDEDLYCDLIEKGENIQNYLVDTVQWHYIASLADEDECLQTSLIDCESPIEQLLSLSFQKLNMQAIINFNPFIDILNIERQYEIKCGGKKYRVDFYIPVWYKNQDTEVFIVECDGYEFHQKTKEQIEKDNIRTRDLQKAGYTVIRFSGTEIWHKPYRCAIEVLNLILSKCKYIKEEK